MMNQNLMTEITRVQYQVNIVFLFGTIINSIEFDVPNFQTRLLYKVDK